VGNLGHKKHKKISGQALEVDCCGSQIGLDLHIGEAASYGARKAVPSLGLPMEAFGAPAMTLVEPAIIP
jgi:hypothetical protein